MPLCFFACDDTSVLYCNDDCLKFFREQAPGTESPAAAQKAASRFPGYQVFPLGPYTCCMFAFPRTASASGFSQGNDRLPVIYESVLNEVEEGVVISDHENRVIFINRAAEAIEGVDARMSLGKRMEELYLPVGNGKKKNSHAAVLNTGIAPNEHLNQYVVKSSHKIMNVVERMYPVNIHGRTMAVFSLIKNLPVIQKSMEQGLELYDYFRENTPHNGTRYTFRSIVGSDIRFVEAISDAKCVARNQTTVLIYGETGTGKELFAQSIHNASPYQNGPFISVNCAAIPSTLLESMFFGTVKGSYTGAANTTGLFEQARNGTLFLDEINSMDISLQAKLLKVIENKTVRRIGDMKEREIRCRILCALNEAPLACIENGKLRRDLYYRLNTLPVLIPPLCRRGEDVFLLMERFCRELKGEFVLSEEVKKIFRTYSWPGNIRELRNLAEYFCFTGSQVITVKDLPPTFQYDGIGTGLSYCASKKAEYQEPVLQPDTAPWKQAMREQGLEPEEYWFVLKMLYCSSENGETVGRERILEAARKEKLLLSQPAVRSILGIFREYGLARV